MNKMKVNLGAAQTTLLIPLLGRAKETKKKNGLLKDEMACKVMDSLEYDFSKWNKSSSLIGASVRTLMIDSHVKSFIENNPKGTVVEIGCGLNTRFERVDNGAIHWFDLDLPDTIELRKNFFKDTERRKMISSSVLDVDWKEIVKKAPGPYMFISEAAIIYLSNENAKKAITQIALSFPNAWFITDTTCKEMVDGQYKHDAMKYLSSESWFKWICDEPKELVQWGIGLELISSKSFLDASDEIKNKMPLTYQLVFKFFPFFVRKKLSGYLINLYKIN